MGHYDKEFSEKEKLVINELRKRIKQKVNNLSKEEVEFAYMVVTHIKDFMKQIELLKLMSK